jgi:hypothetical protein
LWLCVLHFTASNTYVQLSREFSSTEKVTVSQTAEDELLRLCETRIKGKIRALDIVNDGNIAKVCVQSLPFYYL